MIMKLPHALGLGLALGLSGLPVWAQDSAHNSTVEQLQQQLLQLRRQFEETQRQQSAQIEALQRQIEALQVKPPVEATAPAPAAAAPPAHPAPVADAAPAQAAIQTWTPAQPIPVMRSGQDYLNLSFKMLATAGLSTSTEAGEEIELGHHDPAGRGFTLQAAEIALDGAVDPYFRGFGNICMSVDPDGETHVDLGEVYLLTTALPANLQVKAGLFLAEFGRQNQQHAYQWDFVDQPIILNRLLGPHSLRDPGARLSWLIPTPFYTELMLGVFHGQGHSAFSFRSHDYDGTHGRTSLERELHGPGDLLYVPRIASSFDLSDTQTLVAGASGGFGPNNSGADADSQIYGLDLYWKWKPVHAEHGFPFLAWQSEGLYRRYEAGADSERDMPSEDLDDWGFYSQIMWGFKRRWVAGLRGEWADGNTGAWDASDRFRGERIRFSPNLTCYPTAFSKIRLQYNLDDGDRFGTEHSVWLQGEFLLGSHGAHKF